MRNQFSDILQASYRRKAAPHVLVPWVVGSALPGHRFHLASANYVQRPIHVPDRVIQTAPTCCTPDSVWKNLAGVRLCLRLVGGEDVQTWFRYGSSSLLRIALDGLLLQDGETDGEKDEEKDGERVGDRSMERVKGRQGFILENEAFGW